jgi:hypothetical protein
VFRPQRLWHRAEDRATIEPDESVVQRNELEIAKSEPLRRNRATVGERLFVRDSRLFELDKDAVRAERMNEVDERALSARSRLFVDEPDAPRLQLRERGVDVFDTKRDVMKPWTALFDVSSDW